MTCIILVAGHNNSLERQIRLKDENNELRLHGIPKALLPVQGRNGKPECSILDLWWDDLQQRRQFSSVLLVTNADKYKHFERWATANDFPVDNIINDGTTTHDNRIGAVANFDLALRTKGIKGDVMVVSGDMLTHEDFDINGVKRFFDHQVGDLCIYYTMKDDEQTSSRGMLEVDQHTKRVTKFAEKPDTWPTRFAGVVFYCFKAQTCKELLPEFMSAKNRVEERNFGNFMEWLVPRGNVYGMKVPTSFKLIGPSTSLDEYMKVKASRVCPTILSNKDSRITKRAYARVGLMGNPSDGFNGKTIAMSIKNFWAEVSVWESEKLKLLPHPINDPSEFSGLSDLFAISGKEGYVGGLRLMQATCKKFYEHCSEKGVALPKRNFTMKYDTNIPRQVGLAGSSCIVTACLKALMKFYCLNEIDIPKCVQPSLVLSVEVEELYITAGLQDRVIQTYEGIVYMDFAKEVMDAQGYGNYEEIHIKPPETLFLLYARDPSDSGKIHSDVKDRWKLGDPEVVAAMRRFAELTDEGRAALISGDMKRFGELMDANFNLRRELYTDAALGRKNICMIELGRKFGAHMKFPGSGGACVGMMSDPTNLGPLSTTAQQEGFVCIPLIPNYPESE